MAGAEHLLHNLPNRLGPDVRVVRAPCMGACDRAPVCAVGHVQVMRATTDSVASAVVDGAHAFAHFPFKLEDLGCDYYGTSLHKWLLAPIGTGFLYVRRENIESLWGLTPTAASRAKDIRKFEEIGTHPAANHNAIAEALSFHEGMGIDRKSARLRYLRNRWATRLVKTGKFTLHTSMDPAQSCAIGTVQVRGVPTGKAVGTLWEKWRIIATPIVTPEYEGIRVTPNVYTTLAEIDTFSTAMEELAAKKPA